jgi:hypothetical protein
MSSKAWLVVVVLLLGVGLIATGVLISPKPPPDQPPQHIDNPWVVGFFIAGALLVLVGAKVGIPMAARASWGPGARAPWLLLLVVIVLLGAVAVYWAFNPN